MSKPNVTKWFQRYLLGGLSPQEIVAEGRAEFPDAAIASDRFFDEFSDGIHFDVPRRLSAPGHFLTQACFKQWDAADYQFVDPRLMRFSAMLQEVARKRGIPLYVHCAFRGRLAQDAAFQRGVSKLRWPRSAHNSGQAVDIVHGVFHWSLTDLEWRFIHKLGLQCLAKLNAPLKKADKLELDWGGSWSFYDPAHWQIKDFSPPSSPFVEGSPVLRTPRHILRNR
jgi:hypothetical protein